MSDQQDQNEQQQSEGGVAGTAQETANALVEDAQRFANSVIDLGEEGLDVALGALSTAIHALGTAVDKIRGSITGGQ